MKPPRFNTLWDNYSSNKIVKLPQLFKEIGWDNLIADDAYANTCAIRVNLALIKSGVTIPGGRMRIKAGPHSGKLIEPGQSKLSHILSKPSMFGPPEIFKAGEYEKGVGDRSGIVSFFHLVPGIYENGHIDLVMPQTGGAKRCASDCWWASKAVWFWPVE